MKELILPIILILAASNLAFAQSPLAELEKAREIKLLESNREDVKRILAGYDLTFSDNSNYNQWFSAENADIMISYSDSDEKCSDNLEYWNVPKWTVIDIAISPKNPFHLKKMGIDYSKFRKERLYANEPRSYVYHKKEDGIAFEVIEDKITKIYLFPNKTSLALLCNNKFAKEFYSSKRWFIDSKLKQRVIDYNGFADVVELILSRNEIFTDCGLLDVTQNRSCSDDDNKISVSITAKDPENDPLTYNYIVSGGKIVGNGAKVVWDLKGVAPGSYTITAGANDGCGICGVTKTETVTIRECDDCAKEKPQTTDSKKP